jgi:hypothetical protein
MFCFPVKKVEFVGLFMLAVGLLLSGCQAQEMLSNSVQKYTDTAKLSNYSFTSADKFGVVVAFAGDASKSMHGPVIAPLTDQLALMLKEELGVTAISIEEAVFNRWRDDQLANRVSLEGEEPADLDESLFFRQAGYRGFMRVVATELVDGAARNDFDYSLRTKFALRILETTEKGDTSPALAKFTTIRAVCSRRYRSKDTSSQTARLSEGYELTNIQRCAATPVYRAKLRLAEEK